MPYVKQSAHKRQCKVSLPVWLLDATFEEVAMLGNGQNLFKAGMQPIGSAASCRTTFRRYMLLSADLGTHDAHAEQEGKQQLVLLKQAAADIAVESIGEVLLDIGKPHCD